MYMHTYIHILSMDAYMTRLVGFAAPSARSAGCLQPAPAERVPVQSLI